VAAVLARHAALSLRAVGSAAVTVRRTYAMKARLLPAKPPVPTEAEERRLVVRWKNQWISKYPELGMLMALNNELRFARSTRNFYTFWKHLKEQGYTPGIPDFVLPIARHHYLGCWIEMKRLKGGRLSPEQVWWQHALKEAGQYVCVCKGAAETIEKFLWYLQGPGVRLVSRDTEGEETR
jgi:hypothetical protein